MTSIHMKLEFSQTGAKTQSCPEADSNTNEPIFQVATLRPQSAWDERGTGQRRPPRSVGRGHERPKERARKRAGDGRASEREENQKDSSPLLSPLLSSFATSVRFRRRPLQRKHGKEWLVARAPERSSRSLQFELSEGRRGLLSFWVSSSSR